MHRLVRQGALPSGRMGLALGLEFAPLGITSNAICPGPFLTPMNKPIADTEEAAKFIVGAVALSRWGRMEEIQGAASISPAATPPAAC